MYIPSISNLAKYSSGYSAVLLATPLLYLAGTKPVSLHNLQTPSIFVIDAYPPYIIL